MKAKKIPAYAVVLTLLLIPTQLRAIWIWQETETDLIRFQGFEGGSSDNWVYAETPGNGTIETNSDRHMTGNNSLRLTGSDDQSNPYTEFDNVDVSDYDSVEFSVAFSADGPDAGDDFYLDLSYDNGVTWTNSIELVDGYNNCDIAFGETSTSNPTTVDSNPYGVSIPASQVQARLRFDESAGINTNDDYYADDVKLIGIVTLCWTNWLPPWSNDWPELPPWTNIIIFPIPRLAVTSGCGFVVHHHGASSVTGEVQIGYGQKPFGVAWKWLNTGPSNYPSAFGVTNSFWLTSGKYYCAGRWIIDNGAVTNYAWTGQPQTNKTTLNTGYYILITNDYVNTSAIWDFDTPGDTSPSFGSGFLSLASGLSSNWSMPRTTIAFQGFEGDSNDTWGVWGTNNVSGDTGSGDSDPANQRIRSGSYSHQTINSEDTLTFDWEDVSAYSSVEVIVHISSTSPSFGGVDSYFDFLSVKVITNGQNWSGGPTNIEVKGYSTSSNNRWSYSNVRTGTVQGAGIMVQPAGSGNRDGLGDGFSTLTVSVPDGASSVRLRLEARNDENNEVWNVDDVELIGVSTSAVPVGLRVAGFPTGTSDKSKHVTFMASTFGKKHVGFYAKVATDTRGVQQLDVQYTTDGGSEWHDYITEYCVDPGENCDGLDNDCIRISTDGTVEVVWNMIGGRVSDVDSSIDGNPNAGFRIIGYDAGGSTLLIGEAQVTALIPEPTALSVLAVLTILLHRRTKLQANRLV